MGLCGSFRGPFIITLGASINQAYYYCVISKSFFPIENWRLRDFFVLGNTKSYVIVAKTW